MSTKVRVFKLPFCDICADGTLAKYDARTHTGQWGYLCPSHFQSMTSGQLGTGLGQELITQSEPKDVQVQKG